MESAPKLATPAEELAFLRAQVARKEAEIHGTSAEIPQAEIISERIIEHHKAPAEMVLTPEYSMPAKELTAAAEAILASFADGKDEALISLAKLAEEKGIKNALSALERLDSAALADDFHRYLVRYVAAGLPTTGVNEAMPRFKALHMTLYEVALPEPKDEQQAGREKTLKELISAMEQFYAGLLSVEDAAPGEPEYFALELAIAANRPELIFYVAVPNGKRDLFEKQLSGIFPDAQIAPCANDYNIFSSDGTSAISVAKLTASPALPLKEYTEFDYDPLNAVLNAFSKIQREGEGAAFQIIVEPRADRHLKHYTKILQALRKGEKKSVAFATPETMLGEFGHELRQTFFSSKPKDVEKAKQAETREIEANKNAIEQVEKKLSMPIVGVTIRLAASSQDGAKAAQVLGELEASFNQFANTQGNTLAFERVSRRRESQAFEDFSFRVPANEALPLSLRELTTMYHFPPSGIESSPHLKQARFTSAPAPLTLAQRGVLLGTNTYRGAETKVYLDEKDRMRHMYIIGQTGAGKTVLMKDLIAQDIAEGRGCCFIDPHGNDILDILAAVPPSRYEDVIYFDPADLSRPFGLNMLEYDIAKPEQKSFIVNEMFAIFRQLYGDVPESMGPAFEQYFRNATQLVMEDPTSGSTILDIPRVLTNAEFRKLKLSRSMNPVVNQFWTEIATKAGGEASLENIVPYITNKFDDFSANDFIRPLIGQQESSFKFREVIDTKKILLINLSKGRLGERNANLLGLIVVGKLFMAALSRADNPRADYPPFYLYMDEFQNITTNSIPGILSEARKYRLSLTMAHQFLAQIEDKTREAIFGNVGNMAVFRVGEDDAETFAKIFAPVFKALDFVNIENLNCYLKILSDGVPQKPFNIREPFPPKGTPERVADLVQLSALTYGRDRATVESSIRQRYLA